MVLRGSPEEENTFKTIKNECFKYKIWLTFGKSKFKGVSDEDLKRDHVKTRTLYSK